MQSALRTTIDLDATHPTLDDHRPGGLPLFGTAMSIDALAAAARLLGLSASDGAVHNIEVFKPCILAERAHHRLVARFSRPPDGLVGEVADEAAGTVHVRARLGGPQAASLADLLPPNELGGAVEAIEIYRLFFHGPSFRVVARARPGDGTMHTELATHPAIANVPPLARLLEFGLQTAGLLELRASRRMMIPHAIGSIAAAALAGRSLHGCTATARFVEGGCNIDVRDADDARLMAIRGYRTVPLPFPGDAAATAVLASSLRAAGPRQTRLDGSVWHRLSQSPQPEQPKMNDMRQDNRPGLRFPDLLIYRGYAAPVRIEGDVRDLEVLGTIPHGLNGAYIRASADPAYPPLHGTDIFLNGDGMMHMLRLQDGHADLKTRYVQTHKLKRERAARRALFGAYRNPYTNDPSVAGEDGNTGNTSVLWHGGKLFALKEAAFPMQLDPETLETLGYYDFGSKLTGHTFTAHPKVDPRTGELIAFSYNAPGEASKIIDLHWISAEGEITRQEAFEAPYASMVHDFLVSENYIAFTICPMLCDWDRVKRGEAYFVWDPSLPVKVAIIPRAEGVAGIRWFTSPVLGMETHTINAWEEGSKLHLDHFFTRSGWLSQFPHISDPNARELPPFAERWTVDLADPADKIEITKLNGQVGEMPVIDPRTLGRKTEQYYFGTSNTALGPMLEWGPKGPPFTCLCRANLLTGGLDYYYAGPDSAPEEPLFIPKSTDAPDGHGWLLSVVGRRAENRTDIVILDAQDLAAGPVATIKLPCRIHEGFHGTWIPGE